MDFKIEIVTNKARCGRVFDSYEDVEAAGFERSGHEGGRVLREQLVGKPGFKSLCGPMWGGWRDASGEGIYFSGRDDLPVGEIASYSPSKGPVDHYLVRYEDWESYDILSR